jgi:DNA-binding XRE family transcriptional regulator
VKLKQYLDERKTNKIWLAEQLNISVQALYVKLTGEGAFSLEQAFKIKECLRMTDTEFNEVFG